MIDDYLERIGLSYASINKLSASEILSLLHSSHLYSIPFENLDIHLNQPIVLDPALLLAKVVQRQRGGFCYELNVAFAELLKALGLPVEYLSAQVFQDGEFSPDYDHLCLLVNIDQRQFLADVGFGDNFIEPLELRYQIVQDGAYQFKLEHAGEHWVLSRSQTGNDWQLMYRFKTQSHLLREFVARCEFHQTSPASHFTQKVIASIARPDGRFSLSNDRQILRHSLEKEEDTIPDSFSYAFLLEQAMGINLNASELEHIWAKIKPA